MRSVCVRVSLGVLIIAQACAVSTDQGGEVALAKQALSTEFDASLCGDTAGVQDNAPWPAFGACPTGRRSSPHVGTRSAHVNWRAALGGAVRSSPAIAADGTVYVGSDGNRLYAIAPGGETRWSAPLLGAVRSSPAIGSDGTVYVGVDFGGLVALEPSSGAQKWLFPSLYPVRSSVAIGADGTVYAPAGGVLLPGNFLYGIRPDGTQRFRTALNAAVSSAPAIASDGTIYVASDGGLLLVPKALYAIDPQSGAIRWRVSVGGLSLSGPAVAPDGTVYVGSGQRTLRAFNPDGSAKWSYPISCGLLQDCNVGSTPAIGPDGSVYFATLDGRLFALDAAGNRRWDIRLGNRIESSPAVGADGFIYVGSNDSGLYIVNPDAGQIVDSVVTGGAVRSSAAISAYGTVYVGSDDGRLYSIGERYGDFVRGPERIPIGDCNNNRLAAGATEQVCLTSLTGGATRREIYVNGVLTPDIDGCVTVTGAPSVEIRSFEFFITRLMADRLVFLTSTDKHCPVHDRVILGGVGDDLLIGTAQDEYISSGPGVDYIVPRGGRDVIVGGSDPDTIDLTGVTDPAELAQYRVLATDWNADRVLVNAPIADVPSEVFEPGHACAPPTCTEVPTGFERVYTELAGDGRYESLIIQAARQMHDIGGGYIVAGTRRNRETDRLDPFIVKLEPDGDIAWIRSADDKPGPILAHTSNGQYTDVEPYYDDLGNRYGYILSGIFDTATRKEAFLQIVDLDGQERHFLNVTGGMLDENGAYQGAGTRTRLYAVRTTPGFILAAGTSNAPGRILFPDGVWREQPGAKGFVMVFQNNISAGPLSRGLAFQGFAPLGDGVGDTEFLTAELIPPRAGEKMRVALGGYTGAGLPPVGSSAPPIAGFVSVLSLGDGIADGSAVGDRSVIPLAARTLQEHAAKALVWGIADVPGEGLMIAGGTSNFRVAGVPYPDGGFLKLVDYSLADAWGEPDPEAGPFFVEEPGYRLIGGYTQTLLNGLDRTADGGFFSIGSTAHAWSDSLIASQEPYEYMGFQLANHGLMVLADADGLSRRYRGFGHEDGDAAKPHVFNIVPVDGQQTTDLGFFTAGHACPGEFLPCREGKLWIAKVDPELGGAALACSCDNGYADCGESTTGYRTASSPGTGDCGGSCGACAIDCADGLLQSNEDDIDCGGICLDPDYTPHHQPLECPPACVDGGCSDGNPCTLDVCDPDVGCGHDAAANDGLSCNGGAGACANGACAAQCTTSGCNDGNACTTDSCNPAAGCSHGNLADGTACSGGACMAGVCVPIPVTPTYTGDVQPILQTYCAGCHSTSGCGGGACFVTSYAEATKATTHPSCASRGADTVDECIAARMRDGSMPLGSGCTPTNRPSPICPQVPEIELVEDWSAAGAPQN